MTNEKHEYWNKLIAEQKASGRTIRAFCQERGVSDHCFYFWRNRLGLGTSEPVQFALVKTVASTSSLELVLAGGERLRIANGVDAATLRLVLGALRP